MTELIGRKSELRLLEAALDSGIPVALEGPTGVGKTYLVQHYAQAKRRNFTVVSGSAGSTVEHLVGFWRPESNGNNVSLVWQDGVLTHSVRYGDLFVFEELSRAPQDILGRLFSLTDTVNPSYGAPEHGNGDLNIPIQDQFRFIACFNSYGAGYFVSKVDVAFLNRFVVIKLGYPPEKDEIDIIKLHLRATPSFKDDEDLATNMVSLANLSRKQEDTGCIVSPRDGVLWAKMITALGNIKEAFEVAVANKKKKEIWSFYRDVFGSA